MTEKNKPLLIKTTIISYSKVYIPKKIRDKFELKDGDTVGWYIGNKGELIIKSTKTINETDDIISY